MRKLSLVFVAAFLIVTGNVLANNTEGVEPAKSLSSQISNMLRDNSFSDMESDLTAQVRFTLNSEGEIVVLSVDTESVNLERFVKGRLNYQKVDISKVEEGKLFTVPVRIAS
ncbi:hypothetical protein [Maribacter cobaltidurans]|uniref:Uncharacterized protein n=1 Tax=Maribacter cobaltidurans TaxID=1178778 RepID=A0A223V234_9FLAO|nr:hypothetical protein [Maribacter cobaltidurans]ASV29098.1 hypothetical protein CJ263_02025 [Maribacter cobaltidurans]GGD71917.1 hypothetical protein GCM10011412_06930 [Maribacter cobaltidurans]